MSDVAVTLLNGKQRVAQTDLRVRKLFNFSDGFDAVRRPCSADGRDDSIRAEVRLWGEFARMEGFLARRGLFCPSPAANAKFKAIMRLSLWASAWHSSTARALERRRAH